MKTTITANTVNSDNKVSSSQFQKDLKSCLEIIRTIGTTPDGFTQYECRYTSYSLHSTIIIVNVF
jgi:hypothetical protein